MNDKLTSQQEIAMDKIRDWYKNSNITDKQMFILNGYSGSGKSFLIKHAINELGLDMNDVAFLTPTGKSAEVLLGRGMPGQTIHRFIYKTIEVEKEKLINNVKKKVKSLEFMLKPTLDRTYKLFVVDEFSMVSDKIINDILKFGVKVLCCGDPGQLPTIGGDNSYIGNPDAMLTEVVRQAADNPIVQLATDIRSGKNIDPNNYDPNYVRFINKNDLNEDQLKELYFSVDQILAGRNETKKKIDEMYRKFKGIDINTQKMPLKDEKVICLVNSWSEYIDAEKNFNLVNGTIATLAEDAKFASADGSIGKFKLKADYDCTPTSYEFLFDGGEFNGEANYELHQKAWALPDGTYYPSKLKARGESESKADFISRCKIFAMLNRMSLGEKTINRFQFAYCITGHKSQGSEWPTVLVYDEGSTFGKDARKWLYTCVTRAKERVIIIKER